MIITIGRQCGCNGDYIGRKIAEKYNIPFYDKKEILNMAKKSGLVEKYPDFYDEEPMDALMYTISLAEEDRVPLNTPKSALADLIGDRDCVVLGRCGNVAFSERKDKISIFLTGDKEYRIKNIQKKHGFSEREAERLVEETDKRRMEYQKYYTQKQWGAASEYDICMNVTKLHIGEILSVTDIYAQKIQESTGINE